MRLSDVAMTFGITFYHCCILHFVTVAAYWKGKLLFYICSRFDLEMVEMRS